MSLSGANLDGGSLLSLSDDELTAKLAANPLESLVRGNPALLVRIRENFPQHRMAADAVPLELLLPDLSTIPATEKFPSCKPEDPAPPPEPPAGPFERGTNCEFGSAYEPLAAVVERTKSKILSDIEENTAESIARAETAAMSLVAVGRLYKHVEPRWQFLLLSIPGHEGLVQFAIKHLLPAGAKLHNGNLADAGCKLLVGSCAYRLVRHEITEHFNVRKGRDMNPGWETPPDDAPLYGVGVAISRGPSPLAGLRVLLILTNAERGMVAEVVCSLMGGHVLGARNGSHRTPAPSSPLRDALLGCLASPDELTSVLAAHAVTGMNMRCEHPGALLRSGLCTALVKGWRDESKPLASALCAYALADLCKEARGAHSAPWRSVLSEEEIEGEALEWCRDPEAWRQHARKFRRDSLQLKDEYEAGQAIFTAELTAAGLELPPPAVPSVESSPGAPPEESAPAERAGGGEVPLSEEAAIEKAWSVPILAAKKPERLPVDSWRSYCMICTLLEKHFRDQLEANEPYLYNTF